MQRRESPSRAAPGGARTTSAPSVERVQAIVTRIAGPDRSPPDAGPDTPLRDGGFWLDSVDLLEAIIACEAEFGVFFEPEADFTDRSLATVFTLFALIQSKRPS
jgi:acyl carrier protein